ncbi:MAG: hypothetical protein V8Q42_10535 [Anaerovoracaceae bacterium]
MVAAVFGDDHSKDSGESSWSVVSSGKIQTTYTDLNKTREKINKKDTDVYRNDEIAFHQRRRYRR